MPLSQSQKAVLRSDILTGPNSSSLSVFVTNEDWFSIALFYNSLSSSTIWRPDITAKELTGVIVGSAFNALSVQKQNGYFAVVSGGFIDGTQPSIRAWFNDIFGAGATLTALTAISQKLATRFEILLSSVAGTSNVTSVFGQLLTSDDVQAAML